MLGLAGISRLGFSAFVPLATTISGALVALYGAHRVHDIVAIYQGAATQLRFLLARWRDSEHQRQLLRESGRIDAATELEIIFVRECELVMSQENQAWRAEWTSEEPVSPTSSSDGAESAGPE